MTDNTAPNVIQDLITAVEALSPLFDAADGMKADLERRGWSPTMAEAIAHQWISLVLNQIWSANK